MKNGMLGCVFLVMLCMLASVGVANAAIINFEDLGVAYGTQWNPADNYVVTSGGFDFVNGPTSVIADLHLPNGSSNSISGTTEVISHGDLIMTHGLGSPFSLLSFDFGSAFDEVAFSVVGTYVGGGTTSAFFVPDGNESTLETFFLGGGFTNLVQVNWLMRGGVQGLFNVDNIVVDETGTAPVPEPASMLILGLGSLGLFFKKKFF